VRLFIVTSIAALAGLVATGVAVAGGSPQPCVLINEWHPCHETPSPPVGHCENGGTIVWINQYHFVWRSAASTRGEFCMADEHEETGNNGDAADVWVNLERSGVELGYTKELVQGDSIDVRCTNPDGGDVSTKKGDNDGFVVVTFPDGYTGRCNVEITGSNGGTASGTIEV